MTIEIELMMRLKKKKELLCTVFETTVKIVQLHTLLENFFQKFQI